MVKWTKTTCWHGKVEVIECLDHSFAWSGDMPCTGYRRCIYCGKPESEPQPEPNEYYTIKQARQAGFTLEPIKCPHCGHIGETSYNQKIDDYYCAMCGEWASEPADRPKPEPNHQEQVYQCQDCNHTTTERELGSYVGDYGEYVLFCKSCGSKEIQLWVG